MDKNFFGKTCYLIILSFCFLVLSTTSQAAEENPLAAAIANPDMAERCVGLNLIENTDIVDDGFILFYMRNNRVYVNVLPHSCPGLKMADKYMYRLSINRLCDMDVITVLEQLGGSFFPGATCGLGRFYPIDEEIAKGLTKRSNN